MALQQGNIPMLYVDLVLDHVYGMAICSGDEIMNELAVRFGANRVLFATDVDGIYDKDPHIYDDATCIRAIHWQDISNTKDSILSESHSVDVTGGLYGKVMAMKPMFEQLQTVEMTIYNGLQADNTKKVLRGDTSIGTVISPGARS